MTQRTIVVSLAVFLAGISTARAQAHSHLGPASGIAHGVPRVCAKPTVITSVGSGAWSSAATWSSGRVPGAGDAVLVASGTRVEYDAISDGALEIGTVARPIAPNVTAELVIADQPIDTTIDPEQLSVGLIGAGTVRIHGTPMTSTFVRLAEEALKGQTTLKTEQPVADWH